MKVVAALHHLVLAGKTAWDDVPRSLVDHRDAIRRYVAEQGIQTNEVQRSWMLLPCILDVCARTGAERLDLVEIGASAGLNLVWDRYRYHYANGTWGPVDAPLELGGEERVPVPAELFVQTPRVRRRVGIELAPIDLTADEGVHLLKSFVWPDQTWRLEQLDRAVAALRRDPPELVHADAVDALPDVLAERTDDALMLVVQTAALGYVSQEGRAAVRATLDEAGASGPLAYVWGAQPAPDVDHYWGIWAQVWPDGERRLLAHSGFHGEWIRWL